MTKQHSEKRTEAAVGLLLKTFEQNVADTDTILNEFEATHDDYECDQSIWYDALVTGHYAMKEAIDTINNKLNRKNK